VRACNTTQAIVIQCDECRTQHGAEAVCMPSGHMHIDSFQWLAHLQATHSAHIRQQITAWRLLAVLRCCTANCAAHQAAVAMQ
jgi:hypothetical protein